MNKKEMVIIKYKKVERIFGNGALETKDRRFKTKRSMNYVIKKLLKLDFPFKISINGQSLIDNMSYIEIIDNTFGRSLDDKDYLSCYNEQQKLLYFLKKIEYKRGK